MAKLTITEFAKRLGVSVCTVNKALSGKPKVSEKTRARVISEAQRLGYRPNRMAQVLARNPVRLAYLHPAHFESFFGPFEAGVQVAAERLVDQNVSVSVQGLVPSKWGKLLLPAVRRLLREGLSGLILAPINGMDYRGLWALLAEHHVPLVQLGLEVPGSPAVLTVRQDARLSGQMAAELLAQFPGPAAVMIGSRAVGDHAEKLGGFEAEAARRGLPIAAICEHRDDERRSYELARQILRGHSDLHSLYLATDNFNGIHRALAEHGAGHLKTIATGLFPAIRQAMDEGLVHFALDQRMAEQGELAVQHLHDLLSGRAPSTSGILVPPRIAVRSNIDLLASRMPTSKQPPADA